MRLTLGHRVLPQERAAREGRAWGGSIAHRRDLSNAPSLLEHIIVQILDRPAEKDPIGIEAPKYNHQTVRKYET